MLSSSSIRKSSLLFNMKACFFLITFIACAILRGNSLPVKTDYFLLTLDGVKSFEGFYPTTYRCPAGVKTIGYGFTGEITKIGKISKDDAEIHLMKEFQSYVLIVEDTVKVPLTSNQLYALASFTYNCGGGSLKKMVNGPGRLNSGNYKSIEKLLPKYNKANGKVLAGLTKRRQWELKMWKGEF